MDRAAMQQLIEMFIQLATNHGEIRQLISKGLDFAKHPVATGIATYMENRSKQEAIWMRRRDMAMNAWGSALRTVGGGFSSNVSLFQMMGIGSGETPYMTTAASQELYSREITRRSREIVGKTAYQAANYATFGISGVVGRWTGAEEVIYNKGMYERVMERATLGMSRMQLGRDLSVKGFGARAGIFADDERLLQQGISFQQRYGMTAKQNEQLTRIATGTLDIGEVEKAGVGGLSNLISSTKEKVLMSMRTLNATEDEIGQLFSSLAKLGENVSRGGGKAMSAIARARMTVGTFSASQLGSFMTEIGSTSAMAYMGGVDTGVAFTGQLTSAASLGRASAGTAMGDSVRKMFGRFGGLTSEGFINYTRMRYQMGRGFLESGMGTLSVLSEMGGGATSGGFMGMMTGASQALTKDRYAFLTAPFEEKIRGNIVATGADRAMTIANSNADLMFKRGTKEHRAWSANIVSRMTGVSKQQAYEQLEVKEKEIEAVGKAIGSKDPAAIAKVVQYAKNEGISALEAAKYLSSKQKTGEAIDTNIGYLDDEYKNILNQEGYVEEYAERDPGVVRRARFASKAMGFGSSVLGGLADVMSFMYLDSDAVQDAAQVFKDASQNTAAMTKIVQKMNRVKNGTATMKAQSQAFLRMHSGTGAAFMQTLGRAGEFSLQDMFDMSDKEFDSLKKNFITDASAAEEYRKITDLVNWDSETESFSVDAEARGTHYKYLQDKFKGLQGDELRDALMQRGMQLVGKHGKVINNDGSVDSKAMYIRYNKATLEEITKIMSGVTKKG